LSGNLLFSGHLHILALSSTNWASYITNHTFTALFLQVSRYTLEINSLLHARYVAVAIGKTTLSNEEIKPVLLSIVELCLAEDIN